MNDSNDLDDLNYLNSNGKKAPSKKDKWNIKLFLCCLALATGGFQYGYNLSSLNSATLDLKVFIKRECFLFSEYNEKLELFNQITQYYKSNFTQGDEGGESDISESKNDSMLFMRLNSMISIESNQSLDEFFEEKIDLMRQMEIKMDSMTESVWTLINCLFVVGALIGGFTSKYALQYLGRKYGFLFHNIFSIIGAVLAIIAPYVSSPVCVIVSRFFFGLQAGMGNNLTPIYISELPPGSMRGSAVSVFQFLLVTGILLAQILGLNFIFGNAEHWNLLLGFPLILALIGSISLLIYIPESPKALLLNDDYESAKKALQKLRNKTDVNEDLQIINNEVNEIKGQKSISIKQLLTIKDLRWPLITSLTILTIQQLSGINAIFFYSTGIFKDAGIPPEYIQYAILLTGIANIPSTITSMFLLDKLGRRPILVFSLLFMIVDFIIITILLSFRDKFVILKYICIGCIIFYIVLFSLSLGPIPVLYATECFGQNSRGTALAFGSIFVWLSVLIVALIFPILNMLIGQYVFLIFTGFLIIAFVIILKKVPETKGKSPEQILEHFRNK